MAAPSLENGVNVVNTWMYRVLALLSLASHLIIVFYSKIRRRERYWLLRRSVWTAYQLTNWIPPYVLSNLYLGDIEKSPPPQPRLVAFWVPFLLLHLARSDSMSAYSRNDHAIKWRTIALVTFQSMGAFFVLVRYIMVDCRAGTLKPAAYIMFFLGIYRYVESAVALRLSDLSNIRSASEQSVSLHLGDYMLHMREQRGSGELLDDEDALLLAHAMFYICKSAFTDSRVEFDRATVSKILSGGDGKNMRKVVEMQLSLMYDVMYTKAAVVHTWCGYAIRAASPALTATALLLFWLRYQDDVCGGFDATISYILLWTTLALDVRCLVRSVVSTWTLSFLIKARPRHSWFYHQLLCLGRWKKLRCFVMCLVRLLKNDKKYQSSSYRRWWCNIGQHNLLRESSGGGLYRPLAKNSVLEHAIADRLMDLLCKRICNKLFFQAQPPGQKLPTVRHVLEPCRRAIIQQQNVVVHIYPSSGPCPSPGGEQDVNAGPGPGPGPCPCPCPGGEQDVNADPGPGPGQKTVPEQVDQQTGLTLEFGEVVLMWHITTDVFLHCSHGDRDMRDWSEEAKAIKAMSDYMLFLVAVRPRMLPSLGLRSLYETTRDDLILMRSSSKDRAKTDKELATWMLANMNALPDTNNNPILFKGMQDAHALLGLTQDWRRKAPLKYQGGKMRTYMKTRLAELIPDFEPTNHKVDMQDLLSFILDEWERLLLYASTRCSSRESHANQLSRGGELTTILWIITQHADTNLVRHNRPSYFT